MPKRIVSAVQRLNQAARDLARAAYCVRFSLIMAAAMVVVVTVPDQITEYLRLYAEAYRYDSWTSGFVPAFFATLGLLACACWYCARLSLYLLLGTADRPPSSVEREAANWLPRLSGFAPLAATAWTFQSIIGGRQDLKRDQLAEPLASLAWLSLALGLAFVVLLWLRRKWLNGRKTPVSDVRAGRRLRAVAALGAVIFAVVAARPTLLVEADFESPFSALSTVFIWASCVVAVGSFLAVAGVRSRFPFLSLLLVLYAAFGYWGVNDSSHPLRGTRAPLPAAMPTVEEALDAWIGRVGPGGAPDRPKPVILVAAEGGGIRAAQYTALVLAKLQTICPAFADHLFAISGVSGGSVGAAVYAALPRKRAAEPGDGICFDTWGEAAAMDPARAGRRGYPASLRGSRYEEARLIEQVRSILKYDYLSDTLVYLLFRDALQGFIPWQVFGADRAEALEGALERAWRRQQGDDIFAQSFHTVSQDRGGRRVPYLLLNTTDVMTGRPVVISHLRLAADGSALDRLYTLDECLDPRFSAATFASARFPLISPSAVVEVRADASGAPACQAPVVAWRRLVDGGYFENSGVATILLLAEEILQVSARKGLRLQPVIIRVENSGAVARAGTVVSDEAYASTAFPETLSPLWAVLNTRQARGDIYKVESDTFSRRPEARDAMARIVTFAVRDNQRALPLGWALTREARAELKWQSGMPESCAPVITPGQNSANDCAIREVQQILRSYGKP